MKLQYNFIKRIILMIININKIVHVVVYIYINKIVSGINMYNFLGIQLFIKCFIIKILLKMLVYILKI